MTILALSIFNKHLHSLSCQRKHAEGSSCGNNIDAIIHSIKDTSDDTSFQLFFPILIRHAFTGLVQLRSDHVAYASQKILMMTTMIS